MKTGVAYLGVYDVDFVKKDLEELINQGYTHVWHPFSEFDFFFQRDVMTEIIQASAEAGLGVYVSPWGVGKVFPGDTLSELAARHPAMAQVDDHGTQMPAACINSEAFRDFLREWVEVVCKTEAQTILWDAPAFYMGSGEERWCCRCDSCKRLFRKRSGHLMPNSLTRSVRDFRKGCLLEMLSELTGLVHLRGKRNSVCVGLVDVSEEELSLEEISELPTVDEIGAKPYWPHGERPAVISQLYHQNSKRLLEVANQYGKEAQVWIKNFSIAKNNEESVAEATFAAYNEGIRNLFAWAYKGTRCLGSVRSENPGRVWDIQTEAFGECQEKAVMNEMIDTFKMQRSE